MTTPAISQADQNLWAAYGNKLKSQLLQSGTIGDNERFYIAPLSAAGIAAGKNINESIKNLGVFNVGDSLLGLNSPVFMPTHTSYAQRAQQYANQVFLNSDGNQGAVVVYNNAQDTLKKAAARFAKTKADAVAAWKQEVADKMTTDPFASWVVYNAPDFAQASNDYQAASAASAAAAAAISGPDAVALGQIQGMLVSALGSSPAPGFNMSCSPASADQIKAGATGSAGESYLAPAYTINSQYSANVDNFISTYAQNLSKPTTITFKASDASSSSWSNLGFQSNNVSVTGSYCIFFSVTYTQNNQTVTKHISAEEAGSDLEITLTCTGFGTYQITPGKWNPSQLWTMPLIQDSDKALWEPAAYVTQAIIAYGVGLQVKLSSNTSSQIHDYLSKASSSGGSASIFGFNIGLGGDGASSQSSTTTYDDVKNASSGTTVTIPPSNNAYPTLLAVTGTALGLPSNLDKLKAGSQ